jgi:hypothetical protein
MDGVLYAKRGMILFLGANSQNKIEESTTNHTATELNKN